MLGQGTLIARLAQDAEDLRAVQRLRHRCFVTLGAAQGGAEAVVDQLDQDEHDAACHHVIVADQAGGPPLCTYRVRTLACGSDIGQSYSAQFYDLTALSSYDAPMVELGRFCIDPRVRHPDVLRMAWGALASIVDATHSRLLFGCSSFQGTNPDGYRDALGYLARRHLAPPQWRPRIGTDAVIGLADANEGGAIDERAALRQMPPLLRSYLAMGGWVSDHAVIDTAMNTLHVFTGLEIAAIPEARARGLRAAGELTPPFLPAAAAE